MAILTDSPQDVFAFVALLFAALGLSAVLLAVEAVTGRLVGASERSTRMRAGVFFAATVAGGALLVAVSSREWMLLAALAPITILSLLRFTMLANGWWSGWRLSVYTACLLLAFIALCMPLMPRPLDRAALMDALGVGRGQTSPDTISPEALRPVRA